MEIEFSAPSSAATAKSASDRAKFTREDFMKLLTAELTHQDPLEPMNQVEFLNQLTGLQNLESTAALTDGIGALMRFQGLGAASSMIGKNVVATTDDGEFVTGRVDSVSFDATTNDIHLLVAGKEISIANVKEIQADPVEAAIAEFDESAGA